MTSFRAFPYMSVKVSSHYVMRDRKQRVCGQRERPPRLLPHFHATSSLERDFAAGDGRAKRGLKTMPPRRDRKSETTTR